MQEAMTHFVLVQVVLLAAVRRCARVGLDGGIAGVVLLLKSLTS